MYTVGTFHPMTSTRSTGVKVGISLKGHFWMGPIAMIWSSFRGDFMGFHGMQS